MSLWWDTGKRYKGCRVLKSDDGEYAYEIEGQYIVELPQEGIEEIKEEEDAENNKNNG